MGTPDFAVPALDALISGLIKLWLWSASQTGPWQGAQSAASAVKLRAQRAGLTVLKPRHSQQGVSS